MKINKLETLGVRELSVEEMKKTEGGIIWFLVGLVVGIAAGSLIYEAVK